MFLRKKYATAVEELLKAKAINPQDANLYYFLGRVYQAKEDFKKAYSFYELTLQKRNTHHKTHYWWAKALIEQTELSSLHRSSERNEDWIKEALEHLSEACVLDPQKDLYFYTKAKILLLATRRKEAIEAIQAAIDLKGENINYLLLLMRIAHEDGDNVLAVKTAEDVLAKNKFNREANLFLGNTAYEQEDYHKAAAHFKRLRALEIKIGGSTYTSTVKFAFQLGRSLFEVGEFPAASRVFSPIAKQSSNAMLYGARCHSSVGRFDSAIKILRSLIRHHGEVPEARYYLASTLGNLGKYSSALKEVELSTGQDSSVRNLCLSARLLVRMERFEEATKELEKAREMAPTSDEVYFEQGRMEYLSGDYSKAQDTFKQTLQQKPSDARYHLWIGRTMLAQEKKDMAAQYFKSALKYSSNCKYNSEQIRTMKADVYYNLGRNYQK